MVKVRAKVKVKVKVKVYRPCVSPYIMSLGCMPLCAIVTAGARTAHVSMQTSVSIHFSFT